MWYYDDPLFAEEWQIRTGRRSVVYKPILGARTWDFSDGALEQLREQAAANADDETLLQHHAEAALEGLDGYTGQLGQVIQTRTVTQEFHSLSRAMELIGPVQNTPVPVLEWRETGTSTTWTALVHGQDYYIRDESKSWMIRLTEAGLDKVDIYGPNDPAGLALARARYTAGMADKIVDLPADLRLAIYTLARRSFDFRDDTMPGSIMGITPGGFMPIGVSSTLARYQKNWMITL